MFSSLLAKNADNKANSYFYLDKLSKTKSQAAFFLTRKTVSRLRLLEETVCPSPQKPFSSFTHITRYALGPFVLRVSAFVITLPGQSRPFAFRKKYEYRKRVLSEKHQSPPQKYSSSELTTGWAAMAAFYLCCDCFPDHECSYESYIFCVPFVW